MSEQVFPGTADASIVDGLTTYVEHLTQVSVGQRAFPDESDISGGELGGFEASFDSLDDVCLMSVKAQVCRLHADGSVTGVQDAETVRWSNEDLVRDAMSQEHVAAPAEMAVPIGVDIARPVPTIPRGGSVGHEPPECLFDSRSVWSMDPHQWISVFAPELVVRTAPALSSQFCWLRAEGAGSLVCVEANSHA